jgi:hypothetical protein
MRSVDHLIVFCRSAIGLVDQLPRKVEQILRLFAVPFGFSELEVVIYTGSPDQPALS